MTPSYVTFLKENGVTSPQGNFFSNFENENEGLTCTPLRIIQKNLEIIELTGEHNKTIPANKTALATFESQIKKNKENMNVSLRNNILIQFSLKSFNFYIKQNQNKKRFILIQKKSDKNIRKLIPIETRYCRSYQRKIRKRMNWLIYKYGNKNAVTLILTLDPKIFRYNKYLMWKSIKKEMNRFLTSLKYYFKKRGIPFPKYIATIEAQKSGNPHLHFLFLNSKRLMDWRKIRKLWGLGHTSIDRTYDGKNIKYAINYITKYITKTFTKTDKENLLTQSLTWLFNIRSFSTSRGLIAPINPIGLGEWRPLFLIKCDVTLIPMLKEIPLLKGYIYMDYG